MKDNEYRVWNLFDEEDRLAAARHVQGQIEDAEQDLALLHQADGVLAEIQRLLSGMRELAKQAGRPDADREALNNRFVAYRDRIDRLMARFRSGLAPEEARRLQKLLESLKKMDI